jgi:hypothetical protein
MRAYLTLLFVPLMAACISPAATRDAGSCGTPPASCSSLCEDDPPACYPNPTPGCFCGACCTCEGGRWSNVVTNCPLRGTDAGADADCGPKPSQCQFESEPLFPDASCVSGTYCVCDGTQWQISVEDCFVPDSGHPERPDAGCGPIPSSCQFPGAPQSAADASCVSGTYCLCNGTDWQEFVQDCFFPDGGVDGGGPDGGIDGGSVGLCGPMPSSCQYEGDGLLHPDQPCVSGNYCQCVDAGWLEYVNDCFPSDAH